MEVAVVERVFAVIVELEKQTDTDGLEGPPMFIVGSALTTPVPVAIFFVEAPAEAHTILPEVPFVLVFILT